MRRIFALIVLLLLLALWTRHSIAQNFAGAANGIYTNVTITGSNSASAQMILPRIPDGIIPGCVTFSVLTNGTTSTPVILYGTNNVSGGGTPIPPGSGAVYCNPPHWQSPFYAYLAFPGTAIVSVAFTSLTNAP